MAAQYSDATVLSITLQPDDLCAIAPSSGGHIAPKASNCGRGFA
jgi:hypothetical protein